MEIKIDVEIKDFDDLKHFLQIVKDDQSLDFLARAVDEFEITEEDKKTVINLIKELLGVSNKKEFLEYVENNPISPEHHKMFLLMVNSYKTVTKRQYKTLGEVFGKENLAVSTSTKTKGSV